MAARPRALYGKDKVCTWTYVHSSDIYLETASELVIEVLQLYPAFNFDSVRFMLMSSSKMYFHFITLI